MHCPWKNKLQWLVLTMFTFLSCSKERKEVLIEMSQRLSVDQKNFKAAINLLNEMQNLEYLSYEDGKYTVWIKKDAFDLETFYDLELEAVSDLEVIRKNRIKKSQIERLKFLLQELNCIGIRRYLRLDDQSLPFESTNFLYLRHDLGGYYFHFYKSKASAQDKLRLEKSGMGSFLNDSVAVYYYRSVF